MQAHLKTRFLAKFEEFHYGGAGELALLGFLLPYELGPGKKLHAHGKPHHRAIVPYQIRILEPVFSRYDLLWSAR